MVGNKNIIVVEDDPGLLQLISRNLERSGFQPRCVLLGSQAILEAKKDPDCLLLLDYKLPDMTAQDVMETLSKGGRPVPFIIMTGHGDEKIAVQMMKLGAMDYVVKDSRFLEVLPQVVGRACRELNSERVLAETEARLQEFRRVLFTLMSHLPGMAYRGDNDPDRTMNFVSGGAQDLTGYRPVDLTGGNRTAFMSLVHEDDRELVYNSIQTALVEKRPFEVEYRIRCAHGDDKWVWDKGSGVFSSDGELQGIEGFITDITERKKAEEALAESEEKYRRIIETANEGVIIADIARGAITFANRKMSQISGYSRDELTGRRVLELIPGEIGRVRSRLEERKRGLSGQYELSYLRPDGSQGWAIINASPVLDRDGNHISSLVMVTDITLRKNAEIELTRARDELEERVRERTLDLERTNQELAREILDHKQAQEALRRSESALRLLLDQMPCILWTTDRELKVTSVLGTGLAALNQAPNRLVGMDLLDYGLKREPAYPMVTAHKQGLSGKAISIESDMAGRTFHCHIEPLRDIKGEIIGVIGAGLDITERKQAESELRALSNRVVDAQETERRSIAHELHDQIGQSLTALKLSLERSLYGSGEDIQSASINALAVVNELMKRVRDLSLDLRPSMLDDLGLLPALLWLFERYTDQTQVRVEFEHAGLNMVFPPDISTAAYRIVQEALTNVARYAHVDEVMVRAWSDQEVLAVVVEDKGIGFDVREALSGRSLGLSGMRERAFQTGGKLTIDSSPGKGVRLVAELPLCRICEEGMRIDHDIHSLGR
ncbi:MAG: PAS domain S-box protein [Dehalococcoidia bacterium]|nr:PAS domain S-box protein [Dehalococcoidia bacterium]